LFALLLPCPFQVASPQSSLLRCSLTIVRYHCSQLLTVAFGSLQQGTTPLKKAAALLAARRAAVLVEEAERALLGLVALAREVLERLATRHHLAAAHNPAVLVLNKVALLETTGRVRRRSVPDLSLGANCYLNHLILLTAILFAWSQDPGKKYISRLEWPVLLIPEVFQTRTP